MSTQSRNGENACLIDDASGWLARLRSNNCPASVHRAFAVWIEESPQHERAFKELVDAFISAGEIRDDSEIVALRRQVLKSAVPAIRLGAARKRGGMLVAAACMVVAALSVGLFATLGSQPGALTEPFQQTAEQQSLADLAELTASKSQADLVYSTLVGEHARHPLPDGSILELNTASEVRVTYTSATRQIVLLKGQALFDVEHDPARPFIVMAGNQKITALGTQFEVRLDEEDVAVTLLEGRVRVTEIQATETTSVLSASDIDASIELEPGQRLRRSKASDASMTPRAETLPEDALQRALSWRSGRLDFKDEHLSSVIVEINRYSENQVVLVDDSLGTLKVSGNFKAGSVDNFVAALEAIHPVSTDRHDTDGKVRYEVSLH